MTITRTQRVASNSATAFGTGAYASASFTPAANSELVVRAYFIANADDGSRGTTLTISNTGGIDLQSRAATTASPGWSYGIREWSGAVGASPAAMTVSVDAGATDVYVYRLEICDLTSDVGAVQFAAGNSIVGTDADGDGAATITLPASPETSSFVHAGVATGLASGAGSVTPGTGWTEINDSSIDGWLVMQSQSRTGSTSTAVAWDDVCATGTPFGGSCMLAVEYEEVSSATVDQEGFAFGADDGNEAAHTLGTQDADASTSLGVNVILRAILNATGDPASATYTLRAQKNGTGGYVAVPVGAGNAEAFAQPTWGAAGTAASGTTSCAPAYPTGISAATSKLFCVVTGRSNTADTVPTMPAGWTRIGGLEDGTGTWGVDTGTRRVDFFQKDTVDGTETGTVTVSLSGTTANTLRATIFRVEVTSGYGIDVELVTGADTSNDTSYSAAASGNATFDSNRLVLIGVAQNIDTGTNSAQSITASGITFGTLTNRANTAVTNGNDHRHLLWSVPVSSGSGTVAPTFAYTISANGSGPAAFLVLRGRLPAVTNELYIAPSSNIAAGGEATTARLTPPAGKTTSDFVVGRRWDDENGADSIDLTVDDYTEVGWCIATQSPATNGDYWDFRVYAGATPLATYGVTPRLTLGTAAAAIPAGTYAAEAREDPDLGLVAADERDAQRRSAGDYLPLWMGGSGAVYEATASDSLATSDSATAQAAFSATASDAASATDAATAQATFAASGADAAALADSGAAAAVFAAGADDAATLADEASGGLLYAAEASDALTPTDSADASPAVNSSASDAATLDDSAAAGAVFSCSASDAIALSDEAGAQAVLACGATDVLALADAASALAQLECSASDAITLADSATAAPADPDRAATDAMSLNDEAATGAIFNIAVSDAMSLSDAAIADGGASGSVGGAWLPFNRRRRGR